MIRDCPDLAIISREQWDAVQARFRRNTKGGRAAGTGSKPSLVSGLLRCGKCGGSMTVVGASVKAGKRYRTLGCTARNSRGASICENDLNISEKKVTEALVGALQDLMNDPVVIQRFVLAFERRLAERLSTTTEGVKELETRLRESERRRKRITELLIEMTESEGLTEKLREEDDRIRVLRAQLSASKPRDIALPGPDAIAENVKDLVRLLETDPTRGREVLARHLTPVSMSPEISGERRAYRMTGAFNIAAVLSTKTPAPAGGTEVIEKWNSGGLQIQFHQNREVPEIWAPFECVIEVGRAA